MRTPSPPPSSPPQVSSSLPAEISSIHDPSLASAAVAFTSDSKEENPSPHSLIDSEFDNTHTNPNLETESPNPNPNPNADSLIGAEIEDPNLDFVIPTCITRPKSNPDSQLENLHPDSEIDSLGSVADTEDPTAKTSREGSGVESSNPKKTSFSLWNAVVKGPMRRLQERFLGSRWGSRGAEVTKSSIWLLGVCYSLCEEGSSEDVTSTEAHTDFELDYCSRIWFTYRKGFEAIGTAKMTSDVNWGCMLRSGQMLLAQALICHHLGRPWRRKPSEPNAREYLKILQCFGDSPSQDCAFSIHNILEMGAPFGLAAGSWLGPYALCRSLEALAHAVRERSESNDFECKLPMEVYVVSGDGNGERGGAPCICMDDVESFSSTRSDSGHAWTPILLLVPLVLGLDKVNSRYLPSLWATFTFPQSLGILGGKPSASTYLVGVQGDQAFYLDPHEVQQVLIVAPEILDVDTSSYHCGVLKKMPLNAIDPSLALGFYCRDRDDFKDFCKRASELEKDSNGAPMFTVVKSNNKGVVPRGETDQPITLDELDELDEHEEDWQIL